MFNRLIFEAKLMTLNKYRMHSFLNWRRNMAGDFFSCSSTSLSFNIVCCLLSFPVCILHILSKRCSLLLFNSFSNTPFSVTIHNSLSFTWVALQISFFLEWLDMRLHFWFRHLNFLKILFFFFPYPKAEQSLHAAKSMEEFWWKHRKYKSEK